jgi:hypothetical protein
MSPAGMQPAGMSQDDMRDSLQSEFDSLDFREKKFNKNMQVSSAKLEELREKVMSTIFDSLRDIGVDLNDINSISNFVREVEATNPDLLELLDTAFRAIEGDGGLDGAKGAMMGAEEGAMMGAEEGAMMGAEEGAMMGAEEGAMMGAEEGAEQDVIERFRGLRNRLGGAGEEPGEEIM